MEQKQNAIIVDIDGTIAEIDHRLYLIKKTPKDWDSFHKKATEDLPIKENVDTIREKLFVMRAVPIFVTGRPEQSREITVPWLLKNFFMLESHGETEEKNVNGVLFMRPTGDFREDFEIKKEVHDKHLVDKYNIMRVYEDRPQVIRMWEGLGYDVIDVGPGYEF